MRINQDLAQYIIDYNKKIVSYQINIMNPGAVIIASTNPARIGKHHFGAQRVLETGEAYIIDDDSAKGFQDVVPGITLPIRFRNELIGMLGIGAGKNSTLVGKILLSSTELLVEQNFLQNKMNAEKQVRNEFLTLILRDRWERNELYFQHQLKLNNMDIHQSYFVCCASIKEDCFIEEKKKSQTETAILKYERAISNMISEFQMMVFPHKPIVVYQASTLALLLPCAEEDCKNNLFDKGSDYIKKVNIALSHLFGNTYRIGIGGYAADMTQIHECYQRSVYAVNISSMLKTQEKISSFDDVYLEYEMLLLPEAEQEQFCKGILKSLTDPENEVWLHTLDTFFQTNRNTSLTSDKLFIHRNTLLFRLKKVQNITGLDPQSFKDSVRLYTALSLWKCKNLYPSSKTPS